jgi:hypothetical protein
VELRPKPLARTAAIMTGLLPGPVLPVTEMSDEGGVQGADVGMPEGPAAGVAHSVSIREETIVAAITGFLDQYVFSHDRADWLAGLIPATSAERADARARQQAHLTAELARIRTAMAGADDRTSPPRRRHQPRHPGLPAAHPGPPRRPPHPAHHHPGPARRPDRRRRPRPGPALLDELPYLTSQLDDAPADLVAALLDALDIQVLYRPEQQQATIWATLTDTTPAAITALFNDPRIAASMPSPRQSAETSTPGPISDSAQGPIGHGAKSENISQSRRLTIEAVIQL